MKRGKGGGEKGGGRKGEKKGRGEKWMFLSFPATFLGLHVSLWAQKQLHKTPLPRASHPCYLALFFKGSKYFSRGAKPGQFAASSTSTAVVSWSPEVNSLQVSLPPAVPPSGPSLLSHTGALFNGGESDPDSHLGATGGGGPWALESLDARPSRAEAQGCATSVSGA